MRPKGVIVYKTPKPAFKIAPPVETGERQEPEQPQRPKGVLVKGDRPKPPNYICYPMLFGPGMPYDFDPKTLTWRDGKAKRVPKCRVCDGLIHPMENHACEGFKPKYVDHDDAWHERQEAKQEEIRASKEHVIRCGGCGDALEDEDDARWHDEHCERDPDSWRRGHYALNGDEDDLSGYEDEPEEDYCEGDDDGYDCD